MAEQYNDVGRRVRIKAAARNIRKRAAHEEQHANEVEGHENLVNEAIKQNPKLDAALSNLEGHVGGKRGTNDLSESIRNYVKDTNLDADEREADLEDDEDKKMAKKVAIAAAKKKLADSLGWGK